MDWSGLAERMVFSAADAARRRLAAQIKTGVRLGTAIAVDLYTNHGCPKARAIRCAARAVLLAVRRGAEEADHA